MTFDRGDYQAWREKRFNFIVEHYGASFFRDKHLVEVGAGYGHLGNMFCELGADVTCTDGRPDNVAGIRERFPGVKAQVCNIENDFPRGHFDICIHTGVLYHIKNAVSSLATAVARCDHLVLETETLDSDDPFFMKTVAEGPVALPDTALAGAGTRLTASFIERLLSEWGCVFTRCDAVKLNSGVHKYDWLVSGTLEHGPQFRRLWFIKCPS